jgi:hypothetical protein
MNVGRGALDTVPRDWPAGTRVWLISEEKNIYDPVERSDGETVPYRLMPRTSRGSLPIASAPDEYVTLSDRATLPLRPANVTVAGASFGTADIAGLTSIPVTWAKRNRITEATQAMLWTDGTIAGEAGQVVVVRILTESGTLYWTSPDQSGTSYSIARASFGALENAYVEVWSKIGSEFSLQAHRIRVSGLADRLKFAGDESGLLKLAGDEAPGALLV